MDDARCSGHGRLCVYLYVCLSVYLTVPRRIPALLHGPGCNLGNIRGCPSVVHCWAALQSVHWSRCYDNIAPNAKCQRVLVLPLCLVEIIGDVHTTRTCADPRYVYAGNGLKPSLDNPVFIM